MPEPVPELITHLPLLEGPRASAALTDEEAAALVAFGATAWSDYWASTALDWVDQGVWSEEVAKALRRTAQDKTYSQWIAPGVAVHQAGRLNRR